MVIPNILGMIAVPRIEIRAESYRLEIECPVTGWDWHGIAVNHVNKIISIILLYFIYLIIFNNRIESY